MPTQPRALLLALVASVVFGCSTSTGGACAADGTVTVTVTDEDIDRNTNFVCSATVTVTPSSGGHTVTATLEGSDGSNVACRYVANVPPGSYTLSATGAGYTPMSQSLVIDQVGCVTSSPSPRIGLFQDHAMTDAGTDVSVIREASTD